MCNAGSKQCFFLGEVLGLKHHGHLTSERNEGYCCHCCFLGLEISLVPPRFSTGIRLSLRESHVEHLACSVKLRVAKRPWSKLSVRHWQLRLLFVSPAGKTDDEAVTLGERDELRQKTS